MANAKRVHVAKHTTKRVRKTNAKSNTKKTLVKREPASVATANVATKTIQSWIRATSEAISAFDFEQAAEYYKKLEWRWARKIPQGDDGNFDREYPTSQEIREEVTRMINTCIEGVMNEPEEHSCYHCATGGLYVIAHKYPNPDDNWIWVGMTIVETLY